MTTLTALGIDDVHTRLTAFVRVERGDHRAVAVEQPHRHHALGVAHLADQTLQQQLVIELALIRLEQRLLGGPGEIDDQGPAAHTISVTATDVSSSVDSDWSSAVGASSTGSTVIVTVAGDESTPPAVTMYVNESLPL